MNAGLANEIFQWIVILGLILFVLALYWRFGVIVADRRIYLASEFGPNVGESGESVVGRVFGVTEAHPKVIVFTQEHCPLCPGALEIVRRRIRGHKISAAIVGLGSPDYVGRLQTGQNGWKVVGFKEAFGVEEQPRGFPLVLVLDAQDAVVSKVVGSSEEELGKALEPVVQTGEREVM